MSHSTPYQVRPVVPEPRAAGPRASADAFLEAAGLVDAKVIGLDEALRRVTGAQLGELLLPRFGPPEPGHPRQPLLTRGTPASPGAATGIVVFDSATAVDQAAAGERVVLIRPRTTAADLPGILVADAVVTSGADRLAGSAAALARGLGTACVVGAAELRIDPAAHRALLPDGRALIEGDRISVDGGTGELRLGAEPLLQSPVADYLTNGETHPADVPLVSAVSQLLTHADRVRRLSVRADADTAAEARLARQFGADGVGLCRTERAFRGPDRSLVESAVLARTEEERRRALAGLVPVQQAQLAGVLAEMDRKPVSVRLFDAPLARFLPDRTALAVHLATVAAAGRPQDPHEVAQLAAADRLHEHNPMLGMRGARLALTWPELLEVQVRALAGAVAERRAAGGEPRPELLVPLVASAVEMELIRDRVRRMPDAAGGGSGGLTGLRIGAVLELPRATVTADRIAATADFFSFGTDDLTQTVWGLSREDAEAGILPEYLERGILAASPFESLDGAGVGHLLSRALRAGRRVHPGMRAGVHGSHGSDAASIRFFHTTGVDHVSCRPQRVPVARLEAGRAALGNPG